MSEQVEYNKPFWEKIVTDPTRNVICYVVGLQGSLNKSLFNLTGKMVRK